MLQIVALFGVLIIFASLWGVADPQALIRMVQRFSTPAGYAFAILVRVVLGTAALLAAPASLLPGLLYVIGSIAIAAALVLLVMGRARFEQLIQWVAGWNTAFMRVGLVFGMLFGVAMVWVTDVV